MKTPDKPPKKKSPGKERSTDPSGGRRPASGRSGAGKEPAGENESETSDSPSREEVVSTWAKPVTNQDEQEKITNAGEGDIPIANK
ncbi:MAG TPA: hypothetical protein VFO54_10340 [Chryseosolibacter sp.]|nr:hypothetical protein [Chryseosolibacter sp.]